MLESIILAVLGIVCIVVGILNTKGNISMLHAHHRKRVSEENIRPFGRLVGAGTIIMGVGLIIGGIFFGLAELLQTNVYTTVGGVFLIVVTKTTSPYQNRRIRNKRYKAREKYRRG